MTIALLDNLHVALPEMVILTTALLALLASLFLGHKYRSITLIIALIGLTISAVISSLFIGNFKTVILGGQFVSDDLAQLMKLFIAITVFLSFYYSKDYIAEHQLPVGDYYVLGLFSALGMMVLVSSHSLLTIYLGVELLSLPIYAMTAIRRNSGDAIEAALKYFTMGSIASGILLYGLSFVYGATGKLEILDIANAIASGAMENEGMLLAFALVFIVTAIGFKLAAFPFHMWAPDVYQGAPTSVTLFISTAPKIAAVGMAIRLLTTALGQVELASQWQLLLITMALLSTGLGNLLAVSQTNIKRLLAYSAISHAGYVLFGIIAGTSEGYSAALYYILIYALMSAAAFGLITLLSRNNIEIEAVEDLRGLNKRNPWLAFMMLIVMFSMAGVPPTVGFFTKLLVLKALVDVHLTWVAILGLIFAVIGAYYYLRIVKVMYFDDAKEENPIVLPTATNLIFSANCLALLYWGILPSGLISACIAAFSS